MIRFPASTSLHAARRATDLDALSGGQVDVLVVGGGITGVGVALDAVSRGLSVALVERGDLAQGTSRWSAKLVHGGLRYLATGDVGLAYESAVERGILLERTAPHLVRALPMLFPIRSESVVREAVLSGVGARLGDALRLAAGTRRSTLPRPRRLGVTETRRLAPALDPVGLRGGFLSWEGQLVDDARLVIAVARTAAGHGATIVTRCEALSLKGDHARVRDRLTGQELDIRCRVVVNATGVWAGELDRGIALRPSRGTHLVVRADRLGGLPASLTFRMPGESNRYALLLPAGDGRAYLGLTDVPVDRLPDGDPEPSGAEIASLLAAVAGALRDPLTEGDVLGTFAGIRPLLAGSSGATADLSRRHLIHVGGDGLVTVVGGKLTTYRRMAQDAVDAAVRAAGLPAGRCRTSRLPLVGAAPGAQLAALRFPERLRARYGTEAGRVLAEVEDVPGAGEPVAPGLGPTLAELVFAVRHEGALDVADLLDRRTRIGLVAEDRSAAVPAAERALEVAAVAPRP